MVFSVARIISSRLWVNYSTVFAFFTESLNFLLISATLVYFHSASIIGVSIGAALAGVAVGGSKIAWSLWITKLAPDGMEARYMGAHVALTGLRGSTFHSLAIACSAFSAIRELHGFPSLW